MLILLKGETSTAVFLTAPPDPILVESSLGPATAMASRTTLMGFLFYFINMTDIYFIYFDLGKILEIYLFFILCLWKFNCP